MATLSTQGSLRPILPLGEVCDDDTLADSLPVGPVCAGQRRPGDDRPTEASSQEGSGRILLVFEPAKSER